MEVKSIDVAAAAYNVSTTATITLLNGCATGSDYNKREGRLISMQNIEIKGFLEPEDGLVDNQCARVMCLLDLQSNGAAPVITDILDSASSLAQYNLNNRKRFTILVDELFPMGGLTAAYSQSPTVHAFEVDIPVDIDTHYGGTGATVASITRGALYMVTIGSKAPGAGSTLTASTRVRFVDG